MYHAQERKVSNKKGLNNNLKVAFKYRLRKTKLSSEWAAHHLAANISYVSTDEGWEIFSDNAAITSPFPFLITTPNPCFNCVCKHHPVKIWSSAHLMLEFSTWCRLGSLHRILFLRHHTNQATTAKGSRLRGFCPTTHTRSNSELIGWGMVILSSTPTKNWLPNRVKVHTFPQSMECVFLGFSAS